TARRLPVGRRWRDADANCRGDCGADGDEVAAGERSFCRAYTATSVRGAVRPEAIPSARRAEEPGLHRPHPAAEHRGCGGGGTAVARGARLRRTATCGPRGCRGLE